MKITYNAVKRERTLKERGLDFEDAVELFQGPTFTQVDDRMDYGETRYLTYGLLSDLLTLVVWTPRSDTRHVISMRKCNDREKAKVAHRLGQG